MKRKPKEPEPPKKDTYKAATGKLQLLLAYGYVTHWLGGYYGR